jgi:hypothetical protein|tara:strand:+ start:545 stop:802 length:258 start_codon:yes stop_codon:yes gene_type:complete
MKVTRPTINHSQLIRGETSEGVHPVHPVRYVTNENDKKYLRERLAQAVVGSKEHEAITKQLEILEDAIIIYKLTRSSIKTIICNI